LAVGLRLVDRLLDVSDRGSLLQQLVTLFQVRAAVQLARRDAWAGSHLLTDLWQLGLAGLHAFNQVVEVRLWPFRLGQLGAGTVL